MSDDKTKPITTREFLNERDIRIFKMRQAGTSVQEIARRFGVSTSSVTRSVQRQPTAGDLANDATSQGCSGGWHGNSN